MRKILPLLLVTLFLASMTQLRAQNQDARQLKIDQFALEKQMNSLKKDGIPYQNHPYKKLETTNFLQATTIEKDGLVTVGNKKYFLLLQEPSASRMAAMPEMAIDPNKHFHLKIKSIE